MECMTLISVTMLAAFAIVSMYIFVKDWAEIRSERLSKKFKEHGK